jgi:hypothetical protein
MISSMITVMTEKLKKKNIIQTQSGDGFYSSLYGLRAIID